jgi:hypothetical protein
MNISPVGAELFHSDGQTERWKGGQTDKYDVAVGAFRNFADAPNGNNNNNYDDNKRDNNEIQLHLGLTN